MAVRSARAVSLSRAAADAPGTRPGARGQAPAPARAPSQASQAPGPGPGPGCAALLCRRAVPGCRLAVRLCRQEPGKHRQGLSSSFLSSIRSVSNSFCHLISQLIHCGHKLADPNLSIAFFGVVRLPGQTGSGPRLAAGCQAGWLVRPGQVNNNSNSLPLLLLLGSSEAVVRRQAVSRQHCCRPGQARQRQVVSQVVRSPARARARSSGRQHRPGTRQAAPRQDSIVASRDRQRNNNSQVRPAGFFFRPRVRSGASAQRQSGQVRVPAAQSPRLALPPGPGASAGSGSDNNRSGCRPPGTGSGSSGWLPPGCRLSGARRRRQAVRSAPPAAGQARVRVVVRPGTGSGAAALAAGYLLSRVVRTRRQGRRQAAGLVRSSPSSAGCRCHFIWLLLYLLPYLFAVFAVFWTVIVIV